MCKLELFVALILTVGCVFSQKYLTGENVCKVETTETVEETISVPVTKTVRVEEWCLTNFPPRCFRYVNKTVNELQTTERTVKGFKTVCCDGFVQQKDKCISNSSMEQISSFLTTTQRIFPTPSTTVDNIFDLLISTTEKDTHIETRKKYFVAKNTTKFEKINVTKYPKSDTDLQYKAKEKTNLTSNTFDDNNKILGKSTKNVVKVNEVKEISLEETQEIEEKNTEFNLIQEKEVLKMQVNKDDRQQIMEYNKRITDNYDRDPNLAQDKHVFENKIVDLTKKYDMSDDSYINHESADHDYDTNLVKSRFEKSSNIAEADEATVELHLTTSKNVLLGFVLMIAIVILVIIFAVAFVALRCLTMASAENKNIKPTSIFNVPLPDPPGNIENLYEPIKENQEVIFLRDLGNETSKCSTLSQHYTRKDFEGPKSRFFNTLPSAPRSVSYHGHPKSQMANTFEIINPEQVAYDIPPSESRRFSTDPKIFRSDRNNRFSVVSYVDMEASNPLYVNHIKRQQFSTFLNKKQTHDNNLVDTNGNSEQFNTKTDEETVFKKVENTHEDVRLYSNDEVMPFLSLPKDAQDIIKSLPGFKNGSTATYMNEEVTSFQEKTS